MNRNPKVRLILALATAAAAVGGAYSAPPDGGLWKAAAPGYDWEFPRDYGRHPEYKTEWWYVTGHLFAADPAGAADTELAFQMTFFRSGLVSPDQPLPASDWAAADLVMAHASVADPAAGTHRFSEVLRRASPLLGGFGGAADTTLAWCRAPAGTAGSWRIGRVGESWRLQAADDREGFAYDLTCTPVKKPVFHGQDGFSPKSADGDAGSLYFSFTRMEVAGTVTTGDRTLRVRGQSWLDREIFTSSLADDQTGWDWVSLQLEDGRDLMLYRMRGRHEEAGFALGTLVDRDGASRSLPADTWSLEPLERWSSPATGSDYPVRWRLRIPGEKLDLELKPVMKEQENVSPGSGVHYWEGAVTAHPGGNGARAPVSGRGFVELTGYGEGSRPPI